MPAEKLLVEVLQADARRGLALSDPASRVAVVLSDAASQRASGAQA